MVAWDVPFHSTCDDGQVLEAPVPTFSNRAIAPVGETTSRSLCVQPLPLLYIDIILLRLSPKSESVLLFSNNISKSETSRLF